MLLRYTKRRTKQSLVTKKVNKVDVLALRYCYRNFVPIDSVCPSVRHTSDARMNGLIYRNMLCTTRQ